MQEVTIFLDEDDDHQGKPKHEYILRYLMHHNILGATVFKAMGGFGHKHHLNYPSRLGATDEGPIMILFVDEDSKVHSVLPHLKEVVTGGLIVLKNATRA